MLDVRNSRELQATILALRGALVASVADAAYMNSAFATYRRVSSSATLDRQFDKRWLYTIDGFLVLFSCAGLFLQDARIKSGVSRWVVRLFAARLLELIMLYNRRDLRGRLVEVLRSGASCFSFGDRLRLQASRSRWMWRGFKRLSSLYCWFLTRGRGNPIQD